MFHTHGRNNHLLGEMITVLSTKVTYAKVSHALNY